MKKVVDEYTQTSVVYPNDFEVVSEDIPCLGGIIEGSTSVRIILTGLCLY